MTRILINLTVKKFTGKTFTLKVYPECTVSELKEAIAEVRPPGSGSGDQLWQIETHLAFNGIELRDHQPISRYGIADGSVLHIVPPSRERRITLNFEKDSDPGGRFTLSVKPNITVDQLKREIAIEEGIEVTQLKYVALSDGSVQDDDGESIASPTLRELLDGAKISQYQNETIIVFTRPYIINVNAGHTVTSHRVEPSKPIAQLKCLVPDDPSLPPTARLCFAWGNIELDDNETFAHYEIPSETELSLGLPTTFTVELAIDEYGDARKHDIPIKITQTLAEFRGLVQAINPVPQSEFVLVLVGHELAGESKTLKELGFIPDAVIHAVRYVTLRVEAWFKSFDEMTLHPLTRLYVLRSKLESESSELPLNRYWFTLDGKVRLKESRTLWDLGITSGAVIHLRPSTLSLSIKLLTSLKGLQRAKNEGWSSSSSSSSSSVPGEFVMYQVEAEEDESVWGLKERIQLLTGISMEDQRLLIRGKVRDNELTLKQHGLVGGETLLLMKDDKMLFPGEPIQHEESLADLEREEREQEYVQPTSAVSETEAGTAFDQEDRDGNIISDEEAAPKYAASEEEEVLPQIKERLPECTEGSSSQGDAPSS